MVDIRFTEATAVAPEAVVAAATDFSARRPELWPNIDPSAYAVHAVGDTWAEATEGSAVLGGIWARERYDWSTPGTIRAEVQASNVFRPAVAGSFHVRPAGARVSRRQVQGLKGDQTGDRADRACRTPARRISGVLSLIDRATGKSITITLWQNEVTMRASEEAANRLRTHSAAAAGESIAPVERYEVAFSVVTAPAV